MPRVCGGPRALGVALRTQGQAETGGDRIATLGVALGGEEGRELPVEGLELARACGSRPLIDEAEAELAAVGVSAVGAE